MGYDERTAERVREMLRGRRNVVEKRMVGGRSFIVDGSMCCGVTSTGLMVRVGPEALERTLALPHVHPMKFGGRQLAGFVAVDPAGYRTDAQLGRWIRHGLDFVATLPAKPRQVRSAETRPSPSPQAPGPSANRRRSSPAP